jgi:hypothetical protein
MKREIKQTERENVEILAQIKDEQIAQREKKIYTLKKKT